MPTDIEWTRGDDGSKGETWNPTLGCSKVSPGCDNCYAISVAHRAMQPAHEGLTIKRTGERPDWNGTVKCLPDRLDTPLRWRRPRRVFVDSMSDLFHPDVPTLFIAETFEVMAQAAQHTFQVLTKRPQRMASELSDRAFILGGTDYDGPWPIPNVWLGTSIESDRYAFRADHLRATPAAVRFLSLEPLLGPLPSLDLTGIDWVIVGGESGPGARPMHPDWVRDIRDACRAAGVAFFFKQWGAWHPIRYGTVEWVRGARWLTADGTWLPNVATSIESGATFMQLSPKSDAGRDLDGRTWDEMP